MGLESPLSATRQVGSAARAADPPAEEMMAPGMLLFGGETAWVAAYGGLSPKFCGPLGEKFALRSKLRDNFNMSLVLARVLRMAGERMRAWR